MSKVLIIDDSAVARMRCRNDLEELGHDVLEAENGEQGLEQARREMPDLVILDLLMPGEAGGKVLKELQTRHLSIPVIIMTADTQKQTRENCLKLGAKAIINKFRDADEFARTVCEVLDAQRADQK
jgi:twitching motility two-component system response regulator PilH